MGDLCRWVSDNLVSLLGYSQPTVVRYVIMLCKKASSPSQIVNHLAELGISSSTQISLFAEEIFARVERSKDSGPNLYQEREKEAALLARKQKNYEILESDEEDDDTDDVAPSPNGRSKKRSRRERDDDAAGTRKLSDRKLTRKGEEEAIRRSMAMENDDSGTLRKVSRQGYLKNERKKLKELGDDIEDEKFLFEGVKLTEAENRELRHKKEIYELVKKRIDESDGTQEYRLPEAYDMEGDVNQEKRFAVAMQAEEKMNPFSEKEAWEEQQIGKVTLKFGSKNRRKNRMILILSLQTKLSSYKHQFWTV